LFDSFDCIIEIVDAKYLMFVKQQHLLHGKIIL